MRGIEVGDLVELIAADPPYAELVGTRCRVLGIWVGYPWPYELGIPSLPGLAAGPVAGGICAKRRALRRIDDDGAVRGSWEQVEKVTGWSPVAEVA